eukprot:scaffold50221_cov66-Phaeocystis_antarctica.AAC.1
MRGGKPGYFPSFKEIPHPVPLKCAPRPRASPQSLARPGSRPGSRTCRELAIAKAAAPALRPGRRTCTLAATRRVPLMPPAQHSVSRVRRLPCCVPQPLRPLRLHQEADRGAEGAQAQHRDQQRPPRQYAAPHMPHPPPLTRHTSAYQTNPKPSIGRSPVRDLPRRH